MTLIVEDGTGMYEANSYAGPAYAQSYLTRRNRSILWNAASGVAQEAALIAATDYIDKRFGRVFIGQKAFDNVDVPGYNFLKFNVQPVVADKVTIGLVDYTFTASSGGPLDVVIGTTLDETIIALVATINTNADVEATKTDVSALIIRHRLDGKQPEILTSTSAPVRFSWDYARVTGGAEGIEQVLEWPRVHVYNRYGNDVSGVPDKLRQATVEYASRALASGLMPDPITSENGRSINRTFEKVGPIESEIAYSGAVAQIFKKFPEADMLLRDFILGNGGVIR